MATTETSTFNLDLGEIIAEAFELAGSTVQSGFDFNTATRSLDLLTLEWANEGLNLWTLEEVTWDDGAGTDTLTQGTNTYPVAENTISIRDAYIRTDAGNINTQVDYTIDRISVSEYLNIPNKLAQGRPVQYNFQRTEVKDFNTAGAQTATIRVYPTPDLSTTYQLVYLRVKRIYDAGTGVNTIEVPDRFLPCLIDGLALKIAKKSKDPNMRGRIPDLKADYAESLMAAQDEDRERATVRFVPRYYRVG